MINVLPPEITPVHTYARKILFKGAAKNPASVSIGSHNIKFRAILDAFIFRGEYCTVILLIVPQMRGLVAKVKYQSCGMAQGF